MNIIRNPKNKFGNMLLNIATTVILPEVINRVSDTLIKNVMEPKKEERKYPPQMNSYNSNYYNKPTPVYQTPKDNNININLNITTSNPEVNRVEPKVEPKVQSKQTHFINPNIYVPMYMD